MLPLALFLLTLAPQESLDDLLRALDDDDPARRDRGTQRLMERGLDDLAALEAAYAKAEDPDLRARLRHILPHVRRHKYDALIKKLSADGERPKVAQALSQVDPRAVLEDLRGWGGTTPDMIIAALLDIFREDESVFRAVLREKDSSIPAEFAARTVPCLTDGDPGLSGCALRCLESIRKYKGPIPGVDWGDVAKKVAAIAGTQQHPARIDALTALAVFGDDASVEVLLISMKDDDPKVAVTALEELRGFLETRPALAHRGRAAEDLLGSPNQEIRRRAMEILATSPRPDVDAPRVRKALADEPPEVRWGALELAAGLKDAAFWDDIVRIVPEKDGAKAVEVLFRLSPARAAEHLPLFFKHRHNITCDWIRYEAQELPLEALEPIQRGLAAVVAEGDEVSQAAALNIASTVDAGFDAAALAPFLRSPESSTRQDTFERVNSAASPEGVELLRAGLRDANVDVRKEAIRAAGRAKATALADAILDIVGRDETTPAALQALVSFGDRRAIPRAFSVLRSSNNFRAALEVLAAMGTADDARKLLESAREMREGRSEAVSVAAGLLGDRAIDALRPLIDDRRLRGPVLKELVKRKDAGCAAEAAKYLSDSDPEVVRAAIQIIGFTRRAEEIPRLLNLLDESDVQWQAARALACMPREKVAPAVASRLRSPNADLREVAAFALDALDADELADRIDDVLADPSPDVVAYGLAAVRRRNLVKCLDAVKRMSRSDQYELRRDALKTLAQLDWAGCRTELFERLRKREAGWLDEIAPLFASHGDKEAFPLLLDLSATEVEEGYCALVLLSAYRNPDAYAAACQPRLNSIGQNSFDSLRKRACELGQRAGVAVRVEIPPPPFPRASFDRAFGKNDRTSIVSSGGGGFQRGGGHYNLLDALHAAFGTNVVPLLEPDGVRIVAREDAVRIFRAWAADHAGEMK